LQWIWPDIKSTFWRQTARSHQQYYILWLFNTSKLRCLQFTKTRLIHTKPIVCHK